MRRKLGNEELVKYLEMIFGRKLEVFGQEMRGICFMRLDYKVYREIRDDIYRRDRIVIDEF